jgi:uncharacterized protein YjbI with pentapeptide repeats
MISAENDAERPNSFGTPNLEVAMTPDVPTHVNIIDAQLSNSRFRDVDLSAAGFLDAKLARATFCDVDLSEAMFDDVSFRRARFSGVDFSGAAIVDSDLTEMRIDGVLVSELFDAYRARRE